MGDVRNTVAAKRREREKKNSSLLKGGRTQVLLAHRFLSDILSIFIFILFTYVWASVVSYYTIYFNAA